MASGEWVEYLDAACEHLRRTREAVERGDAGPSGPARPTTPLPDELRTRVQVLASGYDQLALEVATRLSSLRRYRRSQAQSAPRTSHFVDQRV
jgi:hypothetical protein